MNFDTNLLLGISLTASFVAGVLALFAPCCITFLLPSYLGTIFKESKKVMFYTLIFSLGLAFILVPIALGFRFFIFFLDDWHKQIYYLGAAFMILMGFMTAVPVFHLPQIFHVTPKVGEKTSVWSVFSLGLMSGLTSACCAPVLFAAVTLTSLSPTWLQAGLVSIAYVVGIVFPLFLISLGYKKAGSIVGKNRKKFYSVFQILGVAIFFVSGVTIAVLNYFNKLEMKDASRYSNAIRNTAFFVSSYFQNPFLDFLVFGSIVFIFIKLLKKFQNNGK